VLLAVASHFRARYTAIALGVLVLGENITAVVLGGVAVLLAGVALTRRRSAASD
jgi:drug/metabolite transporter (DMT)-like permease